MPCASRALLGVSAVAMLTFALHVRSAAACSPKVDCPPSRSASIRADVPTDLGVRLDQPSASCGGQREPDLESVIVTDADGNVVKGSFRGDGWTPTTPLVPGAAYVMTEPLPPRGKPARVFPFVANDGPAPDPKSVKLTFEPAPEQLRIDASVCCTSSDYGEGSCGGTSVCATSAQHFEQQWRLRADGGDLRWFQSFENPDKNAPGPTAAGGELCRSFTLVQPNGRSDQQRICVTAAPATPAPDTCPDVRRVYDGCDEPDAALTTAAKACGADDKGCAVAEAGGSSKTPTRLAGSVALGAALLAWIARRPARRKTA